MQPSSSPTMTSQSKATPPRPLYPPMFLSALFYIALFWAAVHASMVGYFLFLSVRHDEPFSETTNTGAKEVIFLIMIFLHTSSGVCQDIAGPRAAYSPMAGNAFMFFWLSFVLFCTRDQADLRGYSWMVVLTLVWYWVGFVLEWKFGFFLDRARTYQLSRDWNRAQKEMRPV
ncbi:hypothetical protein F4818DRAFT_182827 [Hypoxylon cercidicola]|nr:hypothetical protein F4818DRAFT_182827 [Hypoxylon cercidicola]